MNNGRVQILTAGLEAQAIHLIEQKVLNADLKNIASMNELENIVSHLTPDSFHMILCGPALKGVEPAELAQTFKSVSGETPLYYAPLQRANIDFKMMQEHGYDEVFVLPFEDELFGRKIREIERAVTGAARVVYHSVPIVDFDEDSVLEFSVSIYLPVNKKHVKMFKPGAKIDKAHIDRFKKFRVSSIDVAENEIEKFISYADYRLKQMGLYSSQSYGAKQKLQLAVRKLFRVLMAPNEAGFNGGKDLLEDGRKIVADFTSSQPARALYERLISAQGADDDIYSHCGRVSTLAALLSVATGMGHPEDLAIAGLFHDLGKTRLDPSLMARPFAELNSREQSEYWNYPELGLEILREKKLNVSALVNKIILQQGELANGKGFPNKLPEHKIEVDSFLLILADRLDRAMQIQPGQPRPSLESVLESDEIGAGINAKVWAAVHALLVSELQSAA